MAQIGSLSVKLGLVTVEWDKATDKAKQQAKDLQASFNTLGGGIKSLSDNLKNIGAMVGLVGFGTLYSETKNLTDEVDDLSKSYGLTIPQILAFRGALRDAGGEADSASKIISTLFGKIDDAKSGNDSAIAQFQKLGITFADLQALTPYDAIIRVADGFKQITDQFEKTKAIKDFFGKAGIGLSMDDISDALQKGTQRFDDYAASIHAVGQISDTVKANLENLKIAFANIIAPFASDSVLGIKDFENILRGIGSAALAITIGTIATQLFEVAAAIRAITIAGGIFNVTAGGASPMGILLKVATALGAVGAFVYSANQSVDQKQPINRSSSGTVSDSNTPMDFGNGSDWGGDKSSPMSKEATQKAASVALTNQLIKLDADRAAIQFDQIKGDTLENQLALIKLDAKEKIAAIDAKQAQDLEAIKDTGSDELKGQIKSAAFAERRRVSEQARYQSEQAREKDRLDAARIQYEADTRYIRDLTTQGVAFSGIKDAQTQAEKQAQAASQAALLKQTQDTVRLNQLGNDRLAYENSLARLLPDQRDALMAQFDLEKRIDNFRRNATNLGLDPKVIDAGAAAMRSAGQTTLDLQQQNRDFQRTFVYGWDDAFNQYADSATNAANIARSEFSAVTSSMNSLIDKFVTTGKFSFGDFATSIIADITKIEMKAAAMQLWKGFKSGGGLGGLWDAGKSLLGFADGGDPPMNQPSIVGENGPELFMPKTAGTIIPNGKLLSSGGNTTNVTNYNIQAIDTKSFEERILSSSKAVWAANLYGNKNIATGRGRT